MREDALTAGLLLRGGAKATVADHLGFTPLHYAAGQYFSERIVRDLLAHGADARAVSTRGLTPLHGAVKLRRVAAVRALLDAGASPWVENAVDGASPHTEAAVLGDADILAAFAAAGFARAPAEGSGVWLLASFMNHAPEPTAARRVIGRSMVVHAACDLAAGAEVTTTYAASAEALAAGWGIHE